MSSADIQDCIDARVQGVADVYMDDHAIHKLKVDLLEDTRARDVEVAVDLSTNTLKACVYIGLDSYESSVVLEKRVVRLAFKPPGTFDEGVAVSDLPDDVRKAHADAHVQKAQERSDAQAKANADAEKAQAKSDKAQAKADKAADAQ